MRWIKHLSTAHADPAVAAILEQMGPEGYGIYWLLLEQLAVTMDESDKLPEQTHSELKWAHLLHCSTRTLRNFLQTASELRLICVESAPELRQNCVKRVSNRLRIAVPKLLKYRDEYSKKSGRTPDKIRSRIDREQIQSREEKKREEKNINSPAETGGAHASDPLPALDPRPAKCLSPLAAKFEEDWPKFWYRVGKQAAFRKYSEARKKVPREKLMRVVIAAGPLIMQRAHAQSITPIHPATWLSQDRWDDELGSYIPGQTSVRSKCDKGVADFRRALAREMEERSEPGQAGLIHGRRPN